MANLGLTSTLDFMDDYGIIKKDQFPAPYGLGGAEK